MFNFSDGFITHYLTSLQIIIFYASYSINHTLLSHWKIQKFIYFDLIGFINNFYNFCKIFVIFMNFVNAVNKYP